PGGMLPQSCILVSELELCINGPVYPHAQACNCPAPSGQQTGGAPRFSVEWLEHEVAEQRQKWPGWVVASALAGELISADCRLGNDHCLRADPRRPHSADW